MLIRCSFRSIADAELKIEAENNKKRQEYEQTKIKPKKGWFSGWFGGSKVVI
jgi:hypothetical protein